MSAPAWDVRVGTWQALGADAAIVRAAVFIVEQGIPAELEWDADDATAVHAVAYDGQGQPVATGRLLQPAPQVAQIGRVAVLRDARGQGVGERIMRALMETARLRGDRDVMLHAQRTAENFYRRLGYSGHGEPFDEVGIPHLEMVAPLN